MPAEDFTQGAGYIPLFLSGELQQRISQLNSILKSCTLCPRQCGVNRVAGELGVCRAGAELNLSSAFPHFGEEAPLVGLRGSGTIFVSHCNLHCVFCQNHEISHGNSGKIADIEKLANMMLMLQREGCHNINFVSPTHYVPQLISALPAAIRMGLWVPIVYNCSGYESVEVIRLLDEIVDIYMPDTKFSDEAPAQKFCCAPDYYSNLKLILKEMHRQVGDLKLDERGIAFHGLLIRHLVMPNRQAGTRTLLKFIAEEISQNSYVNIMDQYHPCYRADEFPEINRRINQTEYREAIEWAHEFGLTRGL